MDYKPGKHYVRTTTREGAGHMTPFRLGRHMVTATPQEVDLNQQELDMMYKPGQRAYSWVEIVEKPEPKEAKPTQKKDEPLKGVETSQPQTATPVNPPKS